MIIARNMILVSYLLIAVQLVFFSLPSEVSAIPALRSRRAGQRNGHNASLRKSRALLRNSKRPFLDLLYPVVLAFFLIPIAWSVYPRLGDALFLFSDPVPRAQVYLGSLFLLLGSIWTFVAVVQLKAFRKKYGTKGLDTGGMFSISRNPITLGIYGTGVGLVLVLPSVIMIAGLVLTILHFHRRVILAEYYLGSVYGRLYTDYKAEVARYLWSFR